MQERKVHCFSVKMHKQSFDGRALPGPYNSPADLLVGLRGVEGKGKRGWDGRLLPQ